MKPLLVLAIALMVSGSTSHAQCDNYVLQLLSYVAMGGPTSIAWVIEAAESGTDVAAGSSTFSNFVFTSSANVCLEPGCYHVQLTGNAPFTSTTAGGIITFNGEVVPPNGTLNWGTPVLEFDFCTGEPSATCAVDISLGEGSGGCAFNFANNSTTNTPGNVIWQWTIDGVEAGNGEGLETTFTTEGLHEICLNMVVMEGEVPLCFDNGCISVEATGCGQPSECPSEIWSSTETECGLTVYVETGWGIEGESVNWWFADGTGQIEGGSAISHTYTTPGVYNVCAFYTSPLCAQGVELCTEITVEGCAVECGTAIVTEQVECNQFYFSVPGAGPGTYSWTFGDGAGQTTSEPAVNHNYENAGIYEIHVTYSTPLCPEITLVVTVDAGCDNPCPSEIAVAYDCPGFQAHAYLPGVPESTPVSWYIGGVLQETSLNWLSVEPTGVWLALCAVVEGCEAFCDEVWIADCVQDCALDAVLISGDGCPLLVFQAQGFPEGAVIQWTQNGEPVNTGVITTFSLEEGPNNLCAFYSFEGCSAEWCETYSLCGSACPEEIWSGEGETCGQMIFEIGGFVEGEAVTWYPGDESGAVDGGHFFSHEYAGPGVYTVCAYYTSPLCPGGVELCTVIEVAPCVECTAVVIALDSYVADDGPQYIEWSLSGITDDGFYTEGAAEYSIEAPYLDISLCLPDGCYEMLVCAPEAFNEEAFETIFGEPIDVFGIEGVNEGACNGYTIVFGVNSDCSTVACEASFEPVYSETTGMVEFVNTSAFEGEASFVWNYGNGLSGLGESGSVWYSANGVYEVCLTLTVEGVCSDTYCQPLVIEGFPEDCNGNEMVLMVSSTYEEPGEDTFTLTVSVDGNPVDSFTVTTCYACPESVVLPICIQDGCYTIEFTSESGLDAAEIMVAAYMAGEVLPEGSMTLEWSDETGSFEVCITGVQEELPASLQVYPNPASERLLINFGESGTHWLEWTDMSGKLIRREQVNGYAGAVDITAIPVGIYTLRAIAGTRVVHTRVIVTR